MKMPVLALICATFLAGCASSGGADMTPAAPDTTAAAAGASEPQTEAVASASEPQTEAVASAEESKSRSRLVCKREKPIGSNRVVKTCRTKAEWEGETIRTQNAMSRQAGRGGACVSCGGDGR